MGYHHTEAVCRITIGDSNAKTVLMALAHYANDSTGYCYPSLKRLAEHTESSRSSIQRGIKYLEAKGILTVKRGVGTTPSSYVLSVPGMKLIDQGYGSKRTRQFAKLDTPPEQTEEGGVMVTPLPSQVGSGVTQTQEEVSHRPSGGVTVTPKQSENNQEEHIERAARAANGARAPDPKPEHVVEIWNKIADETALKPVVKLTAERRSIVRARMDSYSIEEFQTVFRNIRTSEYLQGRKPGKTWSCSFDWLMQRDNFIRVMEGQYND